MFLHTEKMGSGDRPLLLLHGWGKSLETMRPLGALLGVDSRVHLIDLPGFGKSPAPDTVWDTAAYADRLIHYMNEVGIQRTDLIGHSFGGKVAMQLAHRHPHRVDRLVLMNSAGIRYLSPQKRRRLQRIAFLRKSTRFSDALFRTALYENWFIPRFASPDYKNAGALRKILVQSVNEDLSGVASAIPHLTLLLWSDNDTETPVEMGRQLQKLIPRAALILMHGKGHEPYLSTGSHLCAHHIQKFLESHP